MNAILYPSPIGPLVIGEEAGRITHIMFADHLPQEAQALETAVLFAAKEQLAEYFAGRRRVFELPLAPAGTAFQQAVWEALQTIPYGQVASYGDIARRIGNPKACRAVGGANNRNPISIVIPCHRVVGANGALVGYGGGLDKKQWLLNLEQQKEGESC